MIRPIDVRNFLQSWHDTGVLGKDKTKCILAMEKYRAIMEACSYLPEHDIIRQNAIMEYQKLERICKARGYIE